MRFNIRAMWGKTALVCCIPALAAGAWLFSRRPAEPVEVKATRPAFRDVTNAVTTNGVVEPMVEFQARANFPGIVENIAVQLGDRVAAGQMLVAMKDPFAAARVATAVSVLSGAESSSQDIQRGGTLEESQNLATDLTRAQLTETQARQTVEMLQQLNQTGAAGGGELENARRRLQDARVTLDFLHRREQARFSTGAQKAAHDRLADARASLTAANMSYNNAHIASPLAGTVYAVSVSNSDFVPMGADLLRVADLEQMQIRAFFDEPEIGKLAEGQAVTVTWDGRPGLSWHGHIRKAPVAARAQGVRSVAECLIKLDDSRRDLLPGTHVVVSVPIEQHKHVLTIPREALQVNGADMSVFSVRDGKLVRVPVRVGLVTLDLVELTAGLSPQDVVAVRSTQPKPLTEFEPVKFSF